MPHLAKNSKSNFQLVFPVLPTASTIVEGNPLVLNIFNTVLPSIDIEEILLPWQGGKVFMEGEITYGDWTVTFHVDESLNNYLLIYDWMMYINDGISRFGREFDDYQISANLILTDNFENVKANFQFNNLWPKSLNEIDLSYQGGNEKMETSVTFKYDFFKKL